MLRKLLLCTVAIGIVAGSVWGFLGDKRPPKAGSAPRSTKKAAVHAFVLTWNSRTYSLKCDKRIPFEEINAELRKAALVRGLKQQLETSSAQIQALEEKAREGTRLEGELESTKDELATVRQELEDAKREADEAKAEFTDLKDTAEGIKTAVSNASFELGRLRRAIDGFAYNDWKTVVPEVESRFRSFKNEFFDIELKMIGLP